MLFLMNKAGSKDKARAAIVCVNAALKLMVLCEKYKLQHFYCETVNRE